MPLDIELIVRKIILSENDYRMNMTIWIQKNFMIPLQ